MRNAEPLSILVVEDNPADLFLIEEMLLVTGLPIRQLHKTERLADTLRLLDRHKIDLLFLDLSLPDSLGIGSFLQIKERRPGLPVIILTGLSDSAFALQALQCGAQDYLVKGEFNAGFLTKSVQYSIGRKKAEERMLASEAKYRQIFCKNPYPMLIADAETGRVLEVNEAAVKKYEYSKEEFLDFTLTCLHQPFALALPAGHVPGAVQVHRKKSGEEMIVEVSSYPIDYFGTTATQMQVNDITGQVRLEKELEQKNQQIIEDVLAAQENERKIIGEELHDNINQILTAIKLTLGYLLENGLDEKEVISKCIDYAALAIEEVRKLSRSLILPSNLRELGLLSSLEMLAKDIQDVTPLNIELQAEAFDESMLTEELKTTLYRIVQEQLNNTLKHAQASVVRIRLSQRREDLELLVCDNGRGFDPLAKSKGVGLYNISNRVKLFQGTAEIESSPGQGCCLRVNIPLSSVLPQQKNCDALSV